MRRESSLRKKTYKASLLFILIFFSYTLVNKATDLPSFKLNIAKTGSSTRTLRRSSPAQIDRQAAGSLLKSSRFDRRVRSRHSRLVVHLSRHESHFTILFRRKILLRKLIPNHLYRHP